jgi:hypothetical protein
MRQPGRGGRCCPRSRGAWPRGITGAHRSLLVRAGLPRTPRCGAVMPARRMSARGIRLQGTNSPDALAYTRWCGTDRTATRRILSCLAERVGPGGHFGAPNVLPSAPSDLFPQNAGSSPVITPTRNAGSSARSESACPTAADMRVDGVHHVRPVECDHRDGTLARQDCCGLPPSGHAHQSRGSRAVCPASGRSTSKRC